jgi:hypothetical protein
MAERLVNCGITTAVMESTDVYLALSIALIGNVQVPQLSDEERCSKKAAITPRRPEKVQV